MKKVVTIGGGGGQRAVLQALHGIPDTEVTAIVNTVDDGGSTGALMREYGVQSMGDARNCLLGLAEESSLKRALSWRPAEGPLAGHNIGNVLIAALEKSGASFSEAIDISRKLLGIRERIVPMTDTSPVLVAEFEDGRVIASEVELVRHFWTEPVKMHVRRLSLKPALTLSTHAAVAIANADVIIVAPGDLYSSIMPFFLCRDASNVWAASAAKKIWIPNVAITPGHIHYKTLPDAYAFFKAHCPAFAVDVIILPSSIPQAVVAVMSERGYSVIENMAMPGVTAIMDDLLSGDAITEIQPHDLVRRSPIRYNAEALRAVLLQVCGV